MVPRPASPTSLLWAHQLKKEHSLLLDRMKALEAKTEPVLDALTSIENVHQQVEAFVADGKDLAGHIDTVQNRQQGFEDKYRDTAATQTTILQRIEAIETDSKTNQQQLTKALKEQDASCDLEKLTGRLDAIEAKRKEDLTRTKAIVDRMEDLERTNVQLKSSNIELQTEITRLKYLHHRDRVVTTPSEATTAALSNPGSDCTRVPCSPLVEKRARVLANRKCPLEPSQKPLRPTQANTRRAKLAQSKPGFTEPVPMETVSAKSRTDWRYKESDFVLQAGGLPDHKRKKIEHEPAKAAKQPQPRRKKRIIPQPTELDSQTE